MPRSGPSLGLLLWSHATDWPAMRDAALLADRLGFDHVWTSDHLYATVGDPHQPILEGWTVVAAWAALLPRARLGLLVSANTLRHPAVVAKMATTIDHISGGRAILGLGAGWFRPEHEAHGIAFGRDAGERIGWLDEAASVVRSLLNGDTVRHEGARYRLDGVRHAPRPIQARLPLMIGGGGERLTLRTVATHADLWNVFGSPEAAAGKAAVLDRHCASVGRDPGCIGRSVTVKLVIRDTLDEARRAWTVQLRANGLRPEAYPDALLGPPETVATVLRKYAAEGFDTVVADAPAPYDYETIERLATEIPRLVRDPERHD